MKHKLIVGMDFLNTVRFRMEARKVVINTLKSTSENKEIREICQIDLGLK